MVATVVGDSAGDQRDGRSGEGRKRPERSPPAHELPGERAQRHTDDIREHGSGSDEPERAGTGGRACGACSGHIGHRPERAGRDRGQESCRQDQGEAGTKCHDDVPGGEDAQGEHQGQPLGQPQREHRHQRRADDHADREDGDHQSGLGDTDLQVTRDLGQQARHDKLGGAHQEGAQREHVDDERQPGGRRLGVFSPYGLGGGVEGCSSRTQGSSPWGL